MHLLTLFSKKPSLPLDLEALVYNLRAKQWIWGPLFYIFQKNFSLASLGMNISLLLGPQVGTRPLVYRLKYLQTKKNNKFVKIPRFFYIKILYCLFCSPYFALLRRQNIGKKFLAPPLDQILDPLLSLLITVKHPALAVYQKWVPKSDRLPKRCKSATLPSPPEMKSLHFWTVLQFSFSHPRIITNFVCTLWSLSTIDGAHND